MKTYKIIPQPSIFWASIIFIAFSLIIKISENNPTETFCVAIIFMVLSIILGEIKEVEKPKEQNEQKEK